MENCKVLLIIPAYNEEKNILKTVQTIKEFAPDLDYIVINDGSTDKTGEILDENEINHIDLIENLGIGGAVQTGYKYAYEKNYDIAVQFDGDGQHDVRYVEKICEPIIDGKANMCIGTRYLDKSASKFQSTAMRRLGSRIISFIIWLFCHKKITDATSGFRAADRKLIKMFSTQYAEDYPEPEAIASTLKNKLRIVEVPVSMNERTEGKSSITIWKSIDYMVKVSLAIIIRSM